MNKNKNQIEKQFSNLLKPLFDTVLMETKIFDNESKLIWLESLRLLLEVYNDNKDCYNEILGAHDFNENSFSSKFWLFTIEMRQFFGINFFRFFSQKFFQDQYISLNESYDCLLIMLSYFVQDKDNEKIQEFLTEEKKISIIKKLLYIYAKECQESLVNEDKFYNLLIIYLKLFEGINLPFGDLFKFFLEPKIHKKSHEEYKFPKFAKITINNLKLIHFFLHNKIGDPNFEKYTQIVLNYLPNHKANIDPMIYIKHTQIPILIFNLMKICFKIKENMKPLIKHTEQALRKYSRENKDMMIGVFFYHFMIENLNISEQFTVINIDYILEHVLAHIQTDKKNINSLKIGKRHYMKGLFDIKDAINIPHQYSFIALFKFFALTLLKILVLTYRYSIKPKEFSYFKNLCMKICQKISFENHQLKLVHLNLIHCLIFPELPLKGYEQFTSTAFTYQQKIQLLKAVKVNEKLIQKEYCNPHFIQYLNKHFEMILIFIEKNKINSVLQSFISEYSFNFFILLREDLKTRFLLKIGKINNFDFFDFFHFFLNGWNVDQLTSIVLIRERNYLMAMISLFYSRVQKIKSHTYLLYDNEKIDQKEDQIYESFLNFLESKGFNKIFSTNHLKGIISNEIKDMEEDDKYRFIIKFLDLIINSENLLNYDYQIIIDILLQINPNFIKSEIIMKYLIKNENKIKIKKYLENRNLLEKEKILFYSLQDTNDITDIEQCVNKQQQKQLDLLQIYEELRNYQQMEKIVIQELKNNKFQDLKVNEKILEKYLNDKWISSQKNLSQWETLEKVSNDTSNFELQLQISQYKQDTEMKLKLLDEDRKQFNDSFGIVDLTSTMIQKIEIFKQMSDIKNPKQKELLFVYNLFFQNEHNVRFSQENLERVLANHQICNEFQQGFDIFQRNNGQEMAFQLNEWRKRVPSLNCEPQLARKMIKQRIFFSEFFFKMYVEKYRNNQELKLQFDQNKTILDNPLYNKMQILKIERFNQIPPSIDLNIISYEESQMQNVIIPSMYKLYKENNYANNQQNILKIKKVIEKQYKNSILLKFKVFDLKFCLKQQNFEKGFEIAREISNQMDETSANGKFFQLFFDLLYNFMIKSNSYNEIFLLDLIDAMMKALVYNYSKNKNKVFYKFLIINYLYPEEKSKRKSSTDMKQINPILEATNLLDYKQKIMKIFSLMPLEIFSQNSLDIWSFLAQNKKKNNDIFKIILQLLFKDNPIIFFSNLDGLSKTINSPYLNKFQNEFQNQIFPNKFIQFSDLSVILNVYSNKFKIRSNYLCQKIIQGFYFNKNLDQEASKELFNLESEIKEQFIQIQKQQLKPLEKILQVINYLENWKNKNKFNQKIFVPNFLNRQFMYFYDHQQIQLQQEKDIQQKKYKIIPFLYPLEQENQFGFKVHFISKEQKIIKMNIMMFKNQKQNQKIHLINQKIQNILFDLFFEDRLLKNCVKDKNKNFKIISNKWYMIDDTQLISLNEIHDDQLLDKHLPFKYFGELENKKSILKMKEIYSNQNFKNYLYKTLEIPEQLLFYSEKIMQSIAYLSFTDHIFGLNYNFQDLYLNVKNGNIQYNLVNQIYEKGNSFKPRLTPNFLKLVNRETLNKKFIARLYQMQKYLKKDKFTFYFKYFSLLLDFNTNEVVEYEKLKNNSDNYYKYLNNFEIEKIIKKVNHIRENGIQLQFNQKPWF